MRALLLIDSRMDLLRMYNDKYSVSCVGLFFLKNFDTVKILRDSMLNLSAANFRYEISPGFGGLTITPICNSQGYSKPFYNLVKQSSINPLLTTHHTIMSIKT
jgi:hypothetical protein